MSHIGALIAALCPNGVERKKLGEVGTVVRGKRFVKNDMIDSGVPCIHYGEIYTKYGISASESYSYVSMDRAKTLRFANPGDVVMASAGEAIDDIGKSVAWLGNEPVAIHDACYAFSSSLDPKFVSYYFATSMFRDEIRKYISSSKISSISTKSVASASIPVPPLPVQQEIVRILDMFTQLEAELEAELEARKLQYEHYKSEAFEFSPEAVQVPLGELVDILQGFAFKSSMYVESGIRIVRISDVQKGTMSDKDLKYYPESAANEIERYKLNAGDLVMSLSGSVGRVAMLTEADLPAALNQRVACIRPSTPRVITRYLFHYLNTNRFEQEAIASTSGGTVKNLSSRWLKEIFIPLPTIEVQQRVVSVLDQFDALVNDLNVGLPAELVARRNQYEYYRDQLLTFKELSV